MEFLLAVIELFAKSYGWDITTENCLLYGADRYGPEFKVEENSPTNQC